MEYGWIAEIGATGAIILFCYLLINAVIEKMRTDTQCLQQLNDTLNEIEKNMVTRDQIILNHLEHMDERDREIADHLKTITEILGKLLERMEGR